MSKKYVPPLRAVQVPERRFAQFYLVAQMRRVHRAGQAGGRASALAAGAPPSDTAGVRARGFCNPTLSITKQRILDGGPV